MRVLDWMQRSSTNDTGTSKNKVPLKKDANTRIPSKGYQKQAPVYASIEDVVETLHTQEPTSGSRPGSGRQAGGVHRSGSTLANRQPDSTRREVETQREFERQRAKLSSHSATGYDMEQKHGGGVTSRADHRRVELERRAPVTDTKPGSQSQRRANTFSYPHNSQYPTPPPVSQSRGGGDPHTTATSRTTNTSSTGHTSNPGYPATKYTGRDYYVLDV